MFKDILKLIDFESNEALLFVNQRDDKNIGEVRRKILYLAKDDYLADAVFFQIKDNNKHIPQIFIFDNTKNDKFNKVPLTEIHKRFWSSEIVPLYFVIEQTEIKIYNTKQKITITSDEKEIINHTDILKISTKIDSKFREKKKIYSPFLFKNGSFWETERYIEKYLKSITKESPFEILIENLHGLRKDLTDSGISIEIANKIVVFTILIKYLEEKKDENGNSVFTVKENIFEKKWNVNDFSELINEGKFLNLLNYLSEKFNGKIFELREEEKRQIEKLPPNILNHLSYFVNANYKTKSKQLTLWRLYSFRYLPVELISRIYEEFIPDKSGVVYTPPFLVDLLIDECMPLDDYEKFENKQFKVIDPACGSGIFCVSAYQRLIDWHIINNYKKTKNWNKNIDIETLKEILVENIFGVDKEPEAVNIAVFSLVLALLEKLTPIQLWEDLDFGDKRKNTNKKFKNLKEKNIVPDDFFNYLQTADNDFDLVIGNPPFIRQNFDRLEKEYHLEIPKELPANLSMLFLDKSINLLKDNGLQCLVLPTSSILYNDGAMEYRNLFLKKYTVPQIIDFTHLRETLFKSGKKKNRGRVATCAFFAKKKKPKKNYSILHLISRRTINEENKMFFAFDTYDFHFVPLNIALSQKYIWKSNLVGGGRLNWIVDRLNRIKPTLGEFLAEKKSEGWSYGEGYILGKRNKEILEGDRELEKELPWLMNNYKEAEWLFEKPSIIAKTFMKDGSFKTEIFNKIKYFQANRKSNKNIFKSPHFIIHETIKDNQIPVTLLEDKDYIFNSRFVGIYSNGDIKSLKKINKYFKTTFKYTYPFYIYLTSGQVLLNLERVITKSDIDNLPYPQTEEEKIFLQLSEVEQIWQEDVFNYYISQGKASKNNPLNDIVDETILKNYANTFTWLMNLNYNPFKDKSFKTSKITKTQSYIAVEFYYCKENIETVFEEKTEKEYQNYFETQIGKAKKITRIVEYIDFANNKIYYIKPLQKRYWLKSIADRDAMKCFAEFGNNIFKEDR